jgi:deoxyribose-phosphate aldolase
VNQSIARIIDHTLLKPDAVRSQVRKLCAEARQHGFATVCVNPGRVLPVTSELAGSEVGVCAVVGFPLGATLTRVKVAEVEAVVEAGATELDMVMNIGRLRDGDDRAVVDDIEAVVRAARGRAVKVIIEACLLTDAEKERATRLVMDAGAAFVKTSTGFSSGGATVEDVALLARIADGAIGVKAAGGIRDLATARVMIEAGATRLGTSSGVKIVEEERIQSKED